MRLVREFYFIIIELGLEFPFHTFVTPSSILPPPALRVLNMLNMGTRWLNRQDLFGLIFLRLQLKSPIKTQTNNTGFT